MQHTRKHIQDVFIRIARDSGFSLSGTDVAIFAGQLLNCSPFTVYAAFGSFDTMNTVADGTHPIHKEKT
jgi:hypothetical protein